MMLLEKIDEDIEDLIVLMFYAFEGKTNIVRLRGRGEFIPLDPPNSRSMALD